MADGGALRRPTQLVGGGALTRFSSRLGRLSHVYLKDRLSGASEYLRIAGYFRSSIFDLVNEEIESIGRNPIPPAKEADVIFGHVRNALSLPDDTFLTDVAFSQIPDEDDFIRPQFEYDVLTDANGLGFFQRNNPVVRHVALRRRETLEQEGLMPRIAVDVHPMKGQTLPTMFAGLGLQTSAAFDIAYEAAEKFTRAFSKRKESAGLLKSLVKQRLCSSVAAGLATTRKLLEGRKVDQGEEDDSQEIGGQIDLWDVIDEERQHLQTIVDSLGAYPSDPKLDAVMFYLLERGWLDLGCIVFSQFYDTVRWVGERLTQRLRGETVAVYAGAGRSGVLRDGEWKSIERDHIKKAVRERRIRLVVATDAACEGLNLQTLGTLINVDLPWNPSRLEQRIGRIKRFGQRRDRVDMLNLVYHGTVDEKVYETLSERMRQRFDIFGTLPDVIEDEWIEDVETLDAKLREFTERKKKANAFDLRYAAGATSDDQRWELCERVLARADVQKRLSLGWGEREKNGNRALLGA